MSSEDTQPDQPSSKSAGERAAAAARRHPVTVAASTAAALTAAVTTVLIAAQPAAEAMGAIFKALGIQAGVVAVCIFSLVGVVSWWQGRRQDAQRGEADVQRDFLRQVIDAQRQQADARDDRLATALERVADAMHDAIVDLKAEIREGQQRTEKAIAELRETITGQQRRIAAPPDLPRQEARSAQTQSLGAPVRERKRTLPGVGDPRE